MSFISLSSQSKKELKRLTDFNYEIARNTQTNNNEDAREIARIYGKNLHDSMRKAGVHDFEHKLSEALLSEPVVSNGNAKLMVPSYMYALSRMRDHYVTIKPENKPIDEWAKRKGLDDAYRIWVTHKPFISRGESNARKEITAKIKSGDLKTVKEVFK